MRLTFRKVRESRIPQALLLCAGDTPRLLSFINEAQERLIHAGGETGWYGGWYKTIFNISSDNEISLDRYIARVINVAVCGTPVSIENQFYEFVEAGVGPQDTDCSTCVTSSNKLELIDRGMFPTQVPISATNKRIRLYATDSRDYGKQVVISGKDSNSRIVRTLNNGLDFNGEVVTLATPFSDTVTVWAEGDLSGIQKQLTIGDVLVYEYDATTGDEDLIALLDARDTVCQFRRYYVSNFSATCCTGCTQVEGMAKLEYVPVEKDTDYLVIGNIPALKEECESIRYSEMDSVQALALSEQKHKRAIQLLQNELSHYMGKSRATVNIPIFGSAKLENQSIGALI